MKIILSLELYTASKIGGHGTILMFRKTTEIQLDAYKIAQLLQADGHITQGNIRIRPINIKVVDEHTLTGYSKNSIHPSNGKLEDFKRFTKDGWIPNVEHAKAIRSQGYLEFFPEKFKES